MCAALIFTLEHAINCPHGELPSYHHNELCAFTATLLSEVCPDVAIEPDLQLLSSETMQYHSANATDEAHLNVKARGFWASKYSQDYFDAKFFNPCAKTYRKWAHTTVYSQLKQFKGLYDQY